MCVWVILDALVAAFEEGGVDGVETDDGGEEADVGFGQEVTCVCVLCVCVCVCKYVCEFV